MHFKVCLDVLWKTTGMLVGCPEQQQGCEVGIALRIFTTQEVGGEREPTTKERLRSVAGRGGPAVE